MSSGIHAYQQTSEQQRRDELILTHLPLVRHVLGRLIPGLPAGVDVDNLEAAGVLGLVEVAAKYDPSRSTQFKTFAYIRIRGAILDELRRNSPLPQHMLERVSLVRGAYRTLPPPVTVADLAAATGLTAEEVADTLAAERFTRTSSWDQAAEAGEEPAAQGKPPQDELERAEAIEQLTEAIDALPPKERTAVILYYKEDLRLKEIAAVMKLSTSRISRLLSKALFELGEMLRVRAAGGLLVPAG